MLLFLVLISIFSSNNNALSKLASGEKLRNENTDMFEVELRWKRGDNIQNIYT